MKLASENAIHELFADNLPAVMPEVCLTIAMCAVIIVPFIKRSGVWPTITAAIGLLVALLAAVWTIARPEMETGGTVFSGMLAVDHFSQFFKVLLIAFTLLIVAQWMIVGKGGTRELDIPDYLCLLLGATTGMALMASANNLLMIFVATEAASLPSFALAGFRKHHRLSTEGSLKYVLFGAVASAVMVYGMSLIYGSVGSLELGDIARSAVIKNAEGRNVSHISPLLAVGLMAMFAGFAFKLSAVPLHFWCPDVFQGAPIEITTFLSVASKGAAVCMLLRFLQTFGAVAEFPGLVIGVAIMGAVTATWGNLVAFHQTNIRRLLAYSSIAHTGYMIMAVALAAQTGAPGHIASAILFYLLVYMFMNLGAFTVAALVYQQTGSEDIRDYAGLARRSPMLAVLMSLFMLSLLGMPGLGGFMSKIFLAVAMSEAGAGAVGMVLIAVLFVNTLISLWYYMRPVYFMAFVSDTQDRPPLALRGAGLAMLGLCAVVLFFTGLLPSVADDLTNDFATFAPVARPRYEQTARIDTSTGSKDQGTEGIGKPAFEVSLTADPP